ATNKTQTSISKKRPYVARFTFKQSAVSSSTRYGLTKRIASGGQMSRENDGFEFHPTRLQQFLDVAYRIINVFVRWDRLPALLAAGTFSGFRRHAARAQ